MKHSGKSISTIVIRVIILFLVILLNVFIYRYSHPVKKIDVTFDAVISNARSNEIQIFWSDSMEFAENQSFHFLNDNIENDFEVNCQIPSNTKYLRIDFGTEAAQLKIMNMKLGIEGYFSDIEILREQIVKESSILECRVQGSYIEITSISGNPYIVVDLDKWELDEQCFQIIEHINRKYVLFAILYFNIIIFIGWIYRHKIYNILAEFLKNKGLVFDLAKNDFRNKFVGAAFGSIWAFIQPIVTILVYWFVFQVGFRAGNTRSVPYALWLSTGLIPWFFFSEAWNSATNSLIEYNYLVKKVVFNISIIPCVKILSALFIHVIFIILLLIMYAIAGVIPNMSWIQVIYYSACMFILVLALTYLSAPLLVFFRDISQIINVLLQVGVWLTPIMWEIDIIPKTLQWIFKLNPMYYIVTGYRKALIEHTWVWDDVMLNIYFWTSMLILLVVGYKIFERLKPHFADVL